MASRLATGGAMTGAREAILARLDRARDERRAVTVPAERGLPPPRPWPERAARFAARAIAASATVEEVADPAAVPGAVAAYLARHGLPPEVCLTASPPGFGAGMLAGVSCSPGPPRPDGDCVVAGCFAAVAEEGVVVFASGPDHAPESAFLAATLVVVVEAGRLVDSLEALWSRMRDGPRPRLLNLVLGPSRTADLGVPSRLGAHGPLRVHVVLVAAVGSEGR